MTHLASQPLSLALRRRHEARSRTALIVIDMQTDFCGKGRLHRSARVRTSPIPAACIEPIKRVPLRHGARRAFPFFTRAKGTAPDLADLPRQQSAGVRDAPRAASASVTRAPCGRVLVRGEAGLGHHPRALLSAAGRDHHRQARQRLVLRDRSRAHPLSRRGIKNIILTGITTDVCVPHHHARGQRSRLRVRHSLGLLRRDRRRQPQTPPSRW